MKDQQVCKHLHHRKRRYLDAWKVGWSLSMCRDPFFPLAAQSQLPFYFYQQHFLFVPFPPTRKYITDTDTIHLFIRKRMNMCQMGWGDYHMFPPPVVTQWGWYENLSYSRSQLPQQNYESQFLGRKLTFQQNWGWGVLLGWITVKVIWISNTVKTAEKAPAPTNFWDFAVLSTRVTHSPLLFSFKVRQHIKSHWWITAMNPNKFHYKTGQLANPAKK